MPWFRCMRCEHPFWQHESIWECGVTVSEESYNNVAGQECYTRDYCRCTMTEERQNKIMRSSFVSNVTFDEKQRHYGICSDDQR